MAFTSADLLVIKNDLATDPRVLGLVNDAAHDEENANKLNTINPTILVDRESVSVTDLTKAVVLSEYTALGAAQRNWLDFIGNTGSINPKAGGEIRTGLLALFPGNTATRAKLNALLQEPASRITELYKLGSLSQGGVITPSDVAAAT
jgi:hypothetical protein